MPSPEGFGLPMRFALKGIVYVTTLLEAKCYPKIELAKLYQQRWKVELDFISDVIN